jgi:sulfur transfer protein SufE
MFDDGWNATIHHRVRKESCVRRIQNKNNIKGCQSVASRNKPEQSSFTADSDAITKGIIAI